MGVLEDAIRDHLDLKRRHGASEEEVEQKELEALGPARREFEGPAEEAEAEAAAEAAAADGDVAEVEPEPLPEPEPEHEPEPEPPIPPEPSAPEAATRIHESPVPDPALTDPRGPDFVEEEEEREQASEPKPRRDFDFD
jgi:hypothetical protein